jgi:transposase
MRGRWEPSDAQWQLIEPTLRPKRRAEGRGRPWQDTGAVLNGIWWVSGTGAQGRDLPERYPPYQACHRCFQAWVREGKLERLWRVLAEELPACGRLPRGETFIAASFPGAKKGASRWGRRSAAKGRKSSLSPMITILLSPFLSKALRRTKASCSKASSDTAPSTASRRD